MEIGTQKSNIYVDKIVGTQFSNFNIVNEGNVLDAFPAVQQVICHKEKIVVESSSVSAGTITINGTVNYSILYNSEDNQVCSFEGEIPFSENIKCPKVNDETYVDTKAFILSTNLKMIDDRNFILKLQVMLYQTMMDLETTSFITGIEKSEAKVLYKDATSLSFISDKLDTVRVDQTISLGSDENEIEQLLWQDVNLKSVNTKVNDGVIDVSGELYVFVLYKPEGCTVPKWISRTLSFQGQIDNPSANEEVVAYVCSELYNSNIAVGMNIDCENKELQINAVVRLAIKLYKEEQLKMVADAYSIREKITPQWNDTYCRRLLIKNESRTKETITIPLDKDQTALQICDGRAEIRVDSICVGDNCLKVKGKIKGTIMYVTSNDSCPIKCAIKEIDFKHQIDAEGITAKDKYYLNWRVEQISASMAGAGTGEIKAVIALETIVFREEKIKAVSDLLSDKIDRKEIDKAPILKGYIVKSEDNLWNLAKTNYTTVEEIMKLNDLESDKISEGDKILIMKSKY